MSTTTSDRPSADTGIRLDHVSFSYGKAAPVIDDLSLTVSTGEFFVLLGPSGCGKTTVLNMIAGFEKPTDGEVSVSGRRVTGPGQDRVVVFQGDDSLLGWRTVRQNVDFGLYLAGVPRKQRQPRVDAALETVQLEAHADKYPRELSGGMKQRVQIARALSSDSSVMLMDEPFGALDAITRTTLQDEMSRIWQQDGRTVVFITHDISEAVILGGRIGVLGTKGSARMKIVDNELPWPRSRHDDRFAHKYGEVEALVKGSAQPDSPDDVGLHR